MSQKCHCTEWPCYTARLTVRQFDMHECVSIVSSLQTSVLRRWTADEARILRVSVGSFLDSLCLVLETMEMFGPQLPQWWLDKGASQWWWWCHKGASHNYDNGMIVTSAANDVINKGPPTMMSSQRRSPSMTSSSRRLSMTLFQKCAWMMSS